MSRKAAQDRRDRQRGGDHSGKEADSLRRCLATGVSLPKWELVRFVAGPDGNVVPDVGNERPGRGAWVKAEARALKKALDKGLLKRALEAEVPAGTDLLVEKLLLQRALGLLGFARKAGLIVTGFDRVKEAMDAQERGRARIEALLEATTPPGLTELVETLLVRRTLSLLGIARRAGLLVTGFERVKETMDLHEIGRARVAALIEASDGSADGRRSVLAKARAMELDAPVCGLFASDELSMALGGANVIHACLLSAGPGGLHARFLQEIGRTAGFRAMTPASWQHELSDE